MGDGKIDSYPRNCVNVAPIVGAALAAMTNPIGSALGESSQLANDLGTTASNSTMLSNLPNNDNQNKTVQPKSGINFVLYNSSLDVVDENTGYLPVEDHINAIQVLATDRMIMTESGFFEIFCNNDAQTPVYYDNMRVTMSSGSVLEVNAYYPYGLVIDGLSTENNHYAPNAYKFGGKEKQEMTGWGDHHARMLEYMFGGWFVPDPLCEKYYHISPYAYCNNDPINAIDPDGRSTFVLLKGDGTFFVVDGDLEDEDDNIYAGYFDKDKKFVRGNSIGKTSSMTSFYDSYANGGKGGWAEGSIIDPNDNSGSAFLNSLGWVEIGYYMDNAKQDQKYDFKVTNGGDYPIEGIDQYRGMPIGKTKDGQTIYTSAKDVGNIGAGLEAGLHLVPWKLARKEFDKLQSQQDGRPSVELPSTVNAQRLGWEIGINVAAKNPIATMFRLSMARHTVWNYLTK